MLMENKYEEFHSWRITMTYIVCIRNKLLVEFFCFYESTIIKIAELKNILK